MSNGERLSHLTRTMNWTRGRESSYDRAGGNADWIRVPGGSDTVIAEIDGPGVIQHIWITVNSSDPLYLRKLVLLAYWDGSDTPSVAVPLGDFFGLGHARTYTYECALFSTSCTTPQVGGGVALNAWVPMPFHRHAKLVIRNEQEQPVEKFYYYVDYARHASLPANTTLFHASWRRENPCAGWTGPGSVWASKPWHTRISGPEGVNLSDRDNYLILETEGRGHFIGVNFSIDHTQRGWWGEGDDMFFIDRDGEREWPPDLHGTGSEDYLCHAWGMQAVNHAYSGHPFGEREDFNNEGKICTYRYHIVDPVPFTKNIRVSIEHGHANNRSDDIASTAYWYQTEPSRSMPALPPVKERLPN